MSKYEIKKIVESYISEYNQYQRKTIEKLEKIYPEYKNKIKYDFKRQCDDNFDRFMKNENSKNEAFNVLQNNKFVKKSNMEIANKYYIRKSNLEQYFESKIFNDLFEFINFEVLEKGFFEKIQELCGNDFKKIKYINNQIKYIIKCFTPFILNNGYNQNFTKLEIGINNSNQGDGAEHIFVAKAMIAGFNSSIVDVGSSGYDAIIEDKNGKLLRVQVKSFANNIFSRKGRDRGGEGQDSSNRRNLGKLVTSKNCDVFVAVNKKTSELFIFKGDEIDSLPEDKINRNDYMANWENWSKIND